MSGISATGTRAALATVAAAGTAVAAYANPNFGTVHMFEGVEDLDLSGEFLYTVNVSPNTAEAFQIGDLMFTSSDNTAGVAVTSTHARDNWLSRPEYSESTWSDSLESIMWDMRFSTSGPVNIDLAVEQGAEYKLQLFFSDAYWTEQGMRQFDIMVEDALAVDEFDIVGVTGRREGGLNRGAVYTYNFTALDSNLDIDLLRGSGGQDQIPIINGFSLEVVPAPGAFALLAAGAAPLLIGRRRRD